MNKLITIHVKCLVSNEDIDLKVEKSIKVCDLKKLIENKLNISYTNKLLIMYKYIVVPSSLNDENRTLFEYHIKNGDILIIGKVDGVGEGSDDFSNISEEFIRKDNVLSSDSNVPDWRCVAKGINLYGICQTR